MEEIPKKLIYIGFIICIIGLITLFLSIKTLFLTS